MLASLLLSTALAFAPSASPATNNSAPLHPSFRHYGVIDGLPSDAVYTVAQDHAGYIWIGTRDGLARFDAQDFQIFRHDPSDENSLPANDVSALLVDAQGRLWAGGEGNGLNVYRAQDHGFAHWLHDPKDARSLSGNDVLSLAQSADGAIWVGVYAGGLNRLLPDARGFSHVRHRNNDADSLLSNNVTALAAAADGGLWIGTDAGLQHRDRRGHLTQIVLPGATSPVTVWQLNPDARGVDAATSAGLFRIDANGTITRMGDDTAAYASLRDGHGDAWIARQGSLDLISNSGALRRYGPLPGTNGALPGAVPTGITRDREGGTWVAVLDGGLAYLPPQWRTFDAWQHEPGQPASLAENQVRALAVASDGALWVGGINGTLDRLQPGDGGVAHFASLLALPHSSITSLMEDHNGRLWVGHQQGLRVLDHGAIRDAQLGNGDAGKRILVLLEASDGNVYLAASGAGVARVDPATLTATALKPPTSGAAAQQVHQLFETADGAIWSGSLAGVARLAPRDDAFHFVRGIAHGPVDAFAFAQDGSLWIARGDALQHYALQSNRAHLLAAIGAAQGWPTVDVGGLTIGADGRIWAITPRGLVVYDPVSRKVHTFAAADGLGDPEFYARTLVREGDGALYAGTLDGVMRVQSSTLQAARATPQIALTGLSVRRDGRMANLDPRRPIVLRWSDRELTATANALSFVDPQRNHYRFRLAGFDPDWVDTGTRYVREFSSLRAGNYRLRVAAANGDGAWSAASAPLSIHIDAPPWATPLAYLAYALAVILLLMFAAWSLRRRLEQKHRFALSAQRQQLAEQANAAKTRFLAQMAHEVRTPMTGVLGMTELLLNTSLDTKQRDFADGIRRSGALLMRQVNDALDLARIDAGKLELRHEPFDPAALLREVAVLEQPLAEQKSLALQVEIAADVPRTVRGDALRVQQVLLNLAGNALKFTHAGGVRLQLQRDNDGIVFAVSDDGPGLTDEECARLFQRFEQTEHGKRHSGSGLGLAISRELVALMDGRIEVQSQPGSGCTFRVILPLQECESIVTPTDSGFRRDNTIAKNDAKNSDHGGRALHILIVEDDPVAAQVIAGLLQIRDHVTVHAPDALAALTTLQSAHDSFDAILLDLDLPGMDGCTLARLLRARGLRIPIIAITAGSAGDEECISREAGMDMFLRKPILPEMLRETLEEALNVSRER